MDISNIISLLGVITSLFISTLNLIYNGKVLRNSLKPDIQVYLDYLSSSDIQYLVIKNFGKTGTKLTNIKHNLPAKFFISLNLENPNSIYLAPNQLIFFPFSSKEVKEKLKLDEIIFEFEYKYGKKNIKFKESISIYPSSLNDNINYTIKQLLEKIYLNSNRNLMK